MNVEVSYPAEFDSLVIPLLMENHFDIETTETDYLVMQTFVFLLINLNLSIKLSMENAD